MPAGFLKRIGQKVGKPRPTILSMCWHNQSANMAMAYNMATIINMAMISPENSIVSNFVHLPVNRVRRAKIWTIWFSQFATQIRGNHVQQAQNMLCILAIGLLLDMSQPSSFPAGLFLRHQPDAFPRLIAHFVNTPSPHGNSGDMTTPWVLLFCVSRLPIPSVS